MKQFRYILEKGSKKHVCPNCSHKTFVRYIDIETRECLPSEFGRCDREVKCSYHANPYKNGFGKNQNFTYKPIPKQQPKQTFIPIDILKQTLIPENYANNVFIQNLLTSVPFPLQPEVVEQVISMYYLGTIGSGDMAGSITFPFIDKNNNIRAIQVKRFDKSNHTIITSFLHKIIEADYKTKKEPLPDWLIQYAENEKLVSCPFGEHLLNKYPNNPIALVEAPKTAIYATLYFGLPQQPTDLVWLAVYNLSSLNYDKCKSLQGRKVILFPDLSEDGTAFNFWSKRADELKIQIPSSDFIVSDLLELNASPEQKANGCDLADFLINLDWRTFRSNKTPKELKPISAKSEKGEKSEALKNIFFNEENYKWNTEELESFYKSITLKNNSIQLNNYTMINDLQTFINSHLSVIKTNNGKRTYLPYINRLQELKQILTNI